jgi:hypothetical protein
MGFEKRYKKRWLMRQADEARQDTRYVIAFNILKAPKRE